MIHKETKKQISFKISSEWRGGTGDQHLLKAVLSQRMSPNTQPTFKNQPALYYFWNPLGVCAN